MRFGPDNGPHPTYSVRVRCGNCNYARELEIPKGVTVGAHPCPRCQCKTLKRSLS